MPRAIRLCERCGARFGEVLPGLTPCSRQAVERTDPQGNKPDGVPLETDQTNRKMRLHHHSLITASLVALLYNVSTPARAEEPPAAGRSRIIAPGAVDLTGWLHVEAYDFEGATVLLTVNGEHRVLPVSRSGRVDIELPAEAEAVLRFEHPGHLSKEILVDTRHSQVGRTAGVRHVSFAVILEESRLMGGQVYAGPVANVGFDKDGGCVDVNHTRSMVVGRTSNAPMVF